MCSLDIVYGRYLELAFNVAGFGFKYTLRNTTSRNATNTQLNLYCEGKKRRGRPFRCTGIFSDDERPTCGTPRRKIAGKVNAALANKYKSKS